jgi:hypothetical protein
VVRCIMFEYVSRPQSLPKYAGAFLSLKKVKIRPGRPRGRQELEAVMSKHRIEWEIVEEDEPWGQQQRVVTPPFVFGAAPVVAAPVVSTPTVTTPMFAPPMVPVATTPTVTTPPITTPSATTSDQPPPATGHQPQAAAQEDVCQCRDLNRSLQPPLQRLPSRHCSCSSTRTVDVSIEENLKH